MQQDDLVPQILRSRMSILIILDIATLRTIPYEAVKASMIAQHNLFYHGLKFLPIYYTVLFL